MSVIESMVAAVGRMNLLAISGGRVRKISETLISLPVAYGYSVEVEYDEGFDLFIVRRVFTRGGKRFIKGEAERVYVEDLAEIAYDASCYHHEFGSVYARS